MERDFKGVWIPKEIYLNTELNWTEKILLIEIDSLDGENGCFATNEHFANHLMISKDRVSKLISKLNKLGYITVNLIYKEGTKQIEKRIIKSTIGYSRKHIDSIVENTERYSCKHLEGMGENNEDNNTINNTINNTNKNNIYSVVIDYLNSKADTNYKHTTKKTQSLINARVKEGFTLEDFKAVIDIKTSTWKDTEMEKYLRPETLFGTKFESYLNEKEVKPKEKKTETRYQYDYFN